MPPLPFRFVILLLLLIRPAIGGLSADETEIRAIKGLIDLRSVVFDDREKPVSLAGEWEFYWNRLVDPGTGVPSGPGEADHYIEVPSYWDRLSNIDPDITATGIATYRLDLLMPAVAGPVAIKFLNITPNAEVFVDGNRVAEMGNVDADRRLSRSGNRSLIIPLNNFGERLTVSVSISNFHNINGGLNRDVLIGTFEAVRRHREIRLSTDALFMGGLLLMGLYQLALYLLHRRRKAPLFMALLCLLAFFFSGFKHEMVLLVLFPGWDGEVRTSFIFLALALAPAAFTYYAFSLYPAHLHRRVNQVIAAISGLLGLFILATPKSIFTRLLLPLELLVLLTAVYNLFMLLRGFFRSGDRQILLYLGGLFFLLAGISSSMLDNAVSGVFQSVSGVFFVFILYQAFLQASIYSYAFREIDSLNSQKSKLEKRNVELFSMSYIDSLTGACNRRLFDDFLSSSWRVNAFSRKTLGMILLDIDEFKNYNEFYGHRQGDACLAKVCRFVREKMNALEQDTLARYGGDEFAVIVSDVDGNTLFSLAENLRKAVEEGGIEHRASSSAAMVTISLGCAVLRPSMDEDPETLIDAADLSLQQAKAEGRNRTALSGQGSWTWNPRLV